MKILNESIDTLKYSDIVDFCTEGNVEGTQIDYKESLPSKGLAKHFASFSNTRGGLIIIGVSEDKVGKPAKYEGINFDSKIFDKIHQYASSVDPRPTYEVAKTDEKDGKVFVLVRIFEGFETPYYVQNDSNIYIRTGNITDPIGLASPKTVELLFEKRQKSELVRETFIRRSENTFLSALSHGEKERLKLIAIEKQNYQKEADKLRESGQTVKPFESNYCKSKVGEQTSMLTISLQPYYPSTSLVAPNEIQPKWEQIHSSRDMEDFPNYSLKPMQDGVIFFRWDESNGFIECHQLYSNGLLYYTEDVQRNDNQYGKRIYIDTIAKNLFTFLKTAGNFYKAVSYQGSLIGYIRLETIDGSRLIRIVPNGYSFFWDDESLIPLENNYSWGLELDTRQLNDPLTTQNLFITKVQEIYWGIGYENPSEKLLKDYLKEKGWLVESNP